MENENITTEAPQVEQPQVEQPQVEAPQESQPEVQFFDNAEDFAKSMQATQQKKQPLQESQYVDPEAAPAEPTQQEQPQYTNQQVEEAMFGYLSERLGRSITSFDDLTYTEQQEAPQLDERVQKINQFVQETGRSPEDYLSYQRLNPDNMDDMSVVLINSAMDYPNQPNNS